MVRGAVEGAGTGASDESDATESVCVRETLVRVSVSEESIETVSACSSTHALRGAGSAARAALISSSSSRASSRSARQGTAERGLSVCVVCVCVHVRGAHFVMATYHRALLQRHPRRRLQAGRGARGWRAHPPRSARTHRAMTNAHRSFLLLSPREHPCRC